MNQEINQLLDWQPNQELAKLPTITPDAHRYGMRHFAVGVSIITGKDGDRRAGLTATAVCSVTADPPRLVVFVNKNVQANEIIIGTGALCVNVLAGDQEDVAKVFAGMEKESDSWHDRKCSQGQIHRWCNPLWIHHQRRPPF